MKRLIYLLVLISFCACRENSSSTGGTASEEEQPATPGSPDDSLRTLEALKSIEDIKTEHSYITSLIEDGSMDSTSVSYNCNGEKEGEIVYFYEKEDLRLIRHSYNEHSHFSAIDDYFIKDGTPFFVFYNRLVWSFAGQGETKDEVTEQRFYIINKKFLKCLKKEFTVLSTDKDAPESGEVPNEEVSCPSPEPVFENFDLLLKHKDQEEKLNCLD